ncbi:MAG: type IV pilin protein [Pseudomonadota bacterium]
MRRHPGFTVSEILTAIVAIVVVAAVAITMWRTHALRTQRNDAVEALLAVQAAQDQFFGKHARYADPALLDAGKPAGLGLASNSRRGFYQITLRNSPDSLAYWATARARQTDRDNADTRCVELRIDQNGRRFAVDSEGIDRSADCWNVN